jgi:hypothetical protein
MASLSAGIAVFVRAKTLYPVSERQEEDDVANAKTISGKAISHLIMRVVGCAIAAPRRVKSSRSGGDKPHKRLNKQRMNIACNLNA